MDAIELKFLLKLLDFTEYRALISQIQPNQNTTAVERDAICRQLANRDLVAFNEEVLKIKIAPPGKALLKLDTSKLPITKYELKVLQSCAESSITPAQTGLTGESRQTLIKALIDRGLIQAEKTQIKEVWLTKRGQEYLQDEYNPSGSSPIITLDMLASYIRFMRRFIRTQVQPFTNIVLPTNSYFSEKTEVHNNKLEEKKVTPISVNISVENQPSDEEIIQIIRDLDRHLGTENYLPIFHVRQKLQSLLTRDELDQALYRLQRNDIIELSSLQEAIAYTPEQIEAGIPQNVGGPLFFIIVN